MHSDLFRLCAILRERGIRVSVLSTGLLLERHAAAIAGNVDDVIVSLDGPPEIHDCVRRIPGAFRMPAGRRAPIWKLLPDFPLTARCTVQRINCAHLRATVAAARELGFNGISFLAADLTSAAFNRAYWLDAAPFCWRRACRTGGSFPGWNRKSKPWWLQTNAKALSQNRRKSFGELYLTFAAPTSPRLATHRGCRLWWKATVSCGRASFIHRSVA